MWISSTAKQAVQAVLCVAASQGDGLVRVGEIAAAVGCPQNYLSKTLHILARAGVLQSTRGPKGGFRLAEPAEKLTLARIVAPFESVGELRCLMGQPGCGDGVHECAAHYRWSSVAAMVESFFNDTTIGDLLEGNPGAAEAARDAVQTVRLSNQRIAHGSVPAGQT